MRSVHRKTKRVRRCDALEGRRRGPRTRRTRREIAETARHVQRRSRGAPGRAATRGTPGLGVGTPRVPTPGTVTDPPTPSRSTSAARGTRVAPNVRSSVEATRFLENYRVRRSFRSIACLQISFQRTTTPTMSSRTPARSRQALMSPKSATTAGGWRYVPVVNTNGTRHDALSIVTDSLCASSPGSPADAGS